MNSIYPSLSFPHACTGNPWLSLGGFRLDDCRDDKKHGGLGQTPNEGIPMERLIMRDCHTHPHRFSLKQRARFGWERLLGVLLAAGAILLSVYWVLLRP